MLPIIKINAIVQTIEGLVHEQHDNKCELYNGDLSNAIYWAYLGKATKNEEATAKAMKLIEEHLGKLEKFPYGYKLGYGIPGFAWAIQFLISNGLMEDQAFLNDLDDLIEKSLKWNFQDDFYDLFTGYIGKGMYFVERYEHTKSEEHAAVLSSVVDAIEASSIHLEDCDGRVWEDVYTSYYTKTRTGEHYYGLGLSHGIPSIVYFLCICHKFGIQQEKTAKMIRQACNWLVKQEITAEHKFPDLIYPDGEIRANHTLAWCYGTISTAIALYAAAKTTEDQQLLDKVEVIIAHAAQKWDCSNIRLHSGHKGHTNPFFCHGMAGLAHMFYQFTKVYNNEAITKASDYWLEQTIASLETYPFGKKDEDEKGLIEGPAGIGAVVLDRISDGSFKWNKIFLTDIERF